MAGSGFCVPPSVFSALSALPGPVAVLGSRQLPGPALLSVARLGRWVGSRRRPLWSGGALGADAAASAGALCQGGSVRWWLPGSPKELPAGSPSPVVRGPFGAFPVSAPRLLARSVALVPFAGGPGVLPPVRRLLGRSQSLLLALRSASGGSVVVFVEQAALVLGRGGSLYAIRQATKLGFVPGQSLFVVGVGPQGFFLAPGQQLSLFQAVSQPAPRATEPPPKGIAGPGLNWSRSSAAGRSSLAGERYDEQTVSGPLSGAFWLGLNFNRQPGRVYQWFERPWGSTGA